MQGTNKANDETDWMAIIGRCLAFLCLDKSDLRTEKIGAARAQRVRRALHARKNSQRRDEDAHRALHRNDDVVSPDEADDRVGDRQEYIPSHHS